ncbi:cytochrome P450 [Rossellomorea marisflavi]|uniref:bifunctional cytochrome P450/NADPH--P450 reductase n=1 Tax=Rossellomorea marisflavi TaxID=189381 RepID=UPI003D294467
MTQTTSYPLARTYGPLGSMPLIDREKPVQSFIKLAQELGPIYQFQFPGHKSTFVSGAEFAKAICNEKQFDKKVGPALQKVRAFGGDGLFTSETTEVNWKKAHNILLPSFSQQAMKGYHAKMVDIASQLIQKWARLNPGEAVDIPEDMTRLTLDTIGLCGFNFRFNSFYREDSHPFVHSMVRALDEAMNQNQRLGIQDKLMIKNKRQFKEDIEYMFSIVDNLIAERKENGDQGEDDLLSHMLKGVDPETGEALSDENIRFQIITFLIAGHETTSGLLSFTLYYLMKHPEVLKKAQKEVESVVGDGIPDYKQVKQLKYVRMILNESLRLWPTAPAFTLYAKEDTSLPGGYSVAAGDEFTILSPQLHRDASVWGDDVESFIPERFENPSEVPHHAFKPFGNGQRACIGQQFAMHEAVLVLGMVIQHFDFIEDADYKLSIKEALTLKPDGLTMQVKPRKGAVSLAAAPATATDEKKEDDSKVIDSHGTPLLVLYGSNMGTAEGIAMELAEKGRRFGFDVETAPLNEYSNGLPHQGAVLIASASYNGNAPDNADEFVSWLETSPAIGDVHFSVFGCGDKNWANTYQRIPFLIDEKLAEGGGIRLTSPGFGDASDDFEGQYDAWKEDIWPALADAFDLDLPSEQTADTSIELEYVSHVSHTPIARAHHAFTAVISENRELLHKDSGRSTRHIEVSLPEGISYREGDHIGVLPENPPELIERVLERFALNGDDYVQLNAESGTTSHLPSGMPVKISELLANHVEMQEPATRAQIRAVAATTVCPPHVVELEALLEDSTYRDEVLTKRVTMLELVEAYMACEIPFGQFLSLLPALKPRYYSIASAPSHQEGKASLTVSVVRGAAWSGKGEYAGIASNYLANRTSGDKIACFIHTPQSNFQLPEQSEAPIVMVGPGTGIAPFRGFIQERRHRRENGETLGQAHLYFGCRNPQHDFLYEDELRKAEKEGLVTLHTAFSRCPGEDKRYVQHALADNADVILPLLKESGHLYICGDGSKMAPDVETTLQQHYQTLYHTTQQEAIDWLQTLEKEGRYGKDVWAGA